MSGQGNGANFYKVAQFYDGQPNQEESLRRSQGLRRDGVEIFRTTNPEWKARDSFIIDDFPKTDPEGRERSSLGSSHVGKRQVQKKVTITTTILPVDEPKPPVQTSNATEVTTVIQHIGKSSAGMQVESLPAPKNLSQLLTNRSRVKQSLELITSDRTHQSKILS
jgi:hypothetical protein